MPTRVAAILFVAANAFAGEYAILANGFQMRIDRHEQAGSTLKLYDNGGVIEMPASAVLRFEPEYVAPPASAAKAEPAEAVADPKQLVQQEAARWGVPVALLEAIARAESGFDPQAVSPKGAIGIMQLMPDTARQLGADPKDPRQNVAAGARYFVDLLRKYQQDPYQVRKAVAAYNAGPQAVDRYQGIPPYRETMNYVQRVVRQWNPNGTRPKPADK
jgi:soluble lytic murein transglycosylase-like protein